MAETRHADHARTMFSELAANYSHIRMTGLGSALGLKDDPVPTGGGRADSGLDDYRLQSASSSDDDDNLGGLTLTVPIARQRRKSVECSITEMVLS